jgi:nicotinate-nucleotide adenylyltransferase
VSAEFAVFGGSFNPPHLAHTLLAAYVLSAHSVERVLVVPTYHHAFGKQLAGFEDRVQMCELAFADLRRVEISCIERELPAPSLTVRTLEALTLQHPGIRLRLVIGTDLLSETHAWHDFQRVAELAPLIVVQRQGHERADLHAPALPYISSTEIRRRLRSGESTAGLLAPAVERHALRRGLYS